MLSNYKLPRNIKRNLSTIRIGKNCDTLSSQTERKCSFLTCHTWWPCQNVSFLLIKQNTASEYRMTSSWRRLKNYTNSTIVDKNVQNHQGNSRTRKANEDDRLLSSKNPLLLTNQTTQTAYSVKKGKSKQIKFMKEV